MTADNQGTPPPTTGESGADEQRCLEFAGETWVHSSDYARLTREIGELRERVRIEQMDAMNKAFRAGWDAAVITSGEDSQAEFNIAFSEFLATRPSPTPGAKE